MAKTLKEASEQLTYREKLGHSKYIDPGLDCSQDETITVQAPKEETDINLIVKRHTPDSLSLIGNALPPKYGDFSNVPSFAEAVNIINAANETFSQLSGDIKKRFDYNPQLLIDFVNDKNNLEEARRLGLVPPLPPQEEKKAPPAGGA